MPLGVVAQTARPIVLKVDASRIVQGIISVHESIPVGAGPLTLRYPKWIPGEHGPNGAVVNVAGVVVRAGTQHLTWRRDLVDGYAFHVDVPAGTTTLDVDFEYLGDNQGDYSQARLSTPNMLTLTWNKVLLLPSVDDYATQTIAPTLRLPGPQWQYATALETASQRGADVSFVPVTQEQLVDSPLNAGLNFKRWDLGSIDGAKVDLAAIADTPEQLAADDKTVGKLRALVTQMGALYGHRHFNHYTFLLTLSEVMPGNGVEHHQSSDDGTKGDFLTDPDGLKSEADLLPHEFNHSWDGKFRRPFDLATRNLQDPMQGDLLWVYEGMTQFYGELQAERSGLHTPQEWMDGLAAEYASLDATRGRDWRPILDTGASAPFLYGSGAAWRSERRAVDFYIEGNLMWLEASLKIKQLTGGQKSLDDVARAFFGGPESTGPRVFTYNRGDLIAALNAVAPSDWAAFFASRIDAIAPHPPDPFTAAGWRVVYKDKPSEVEKLRNGRRKLVDAIYSLGFEAAADGTIRDVVPGSPAFTAGLGPGLKVVALNDRAWDGQTWLDQVLTSARTGTPIRILTLGGNVYSTVSISYTGGPRFPQLERIPGTTDLLSAIAEPLAAK